jgi:CBS domain containing-hemolysin-like protein
MWLIEIAIVLLLILPDGFFAMSELAVVNSRHGRLEQLAAMKGKRTPLGPGISKGIELIAKQIFGRVHISRTIHPLAPLNVPDRASCHEQQQSSGTRAEGQS